MNLNRLQVITSNPHQFQQSIRRKTRYNDATWTDNKGIYISERIRASDARASKMSRI